MGFEDRDYLREEAKRYGGAQWGGGGFRPGGGNPEWAIKFILIANIAVYILQNLTGKTGAGAEFHAGVTQYLSLSLADLQKFQIWRLVTYGFCHSSSIWHIVFNMYGLWLFGRMIEPTYRSREFLNFYLAGIVISGIVYLITQAVAVQTMGARPDNVIIGASGGVVAVAILTARNFPTTVFLVMFVVPMQLKYIAILFVAIDILGALDGGDHVAHSAHLAGAAFGFLYYQYRWNISGLLMFATEPLRNWKARRRHNMHQRQLHVFDPGDDDLREEVDRILAKISAHGEASLTDDERRTLERASRIFRGG